MAAVFVEVAPGVYINPDQVTLVRATTPTEMHLKPRWEKGRRQPFVTILLQNDQRYYVRGYTSTVAKKLSTGKEEKDKCGS
jgi:hypothetical protein